MPNSDTKQDGVYSIHYDSESHVSVILQGAGSVWCKVLPYCIFNAALAAGLQILKYSYDVDLGFTDKGHSLMTLFVSFLIVSRVSISLGRYNESRAHLGKMYREARELVQNLVVFTKVDQSESAKQYRNDVAYDISIMLRMAMAVIDFPETNLPCWELPELGGKPKEFIMTNLKIADVCRQGSKGQEHGAESNMRVPIQMSYYLREQIFAINDYLETTEIGAWQFGKMFGSIDSFMGGYYGIRKFITTPFPFPLVQMARTFMFIYLETLPFALLDTVADSMYVHMAIVFLVTYGFVGLETVSIELDNPFGNDENDFDNLGMAVVSKKRGITNFEMVLSKNCIVFLLALLAYAIF
jgi:predicted membrane chloride channel (bestrophin family)